MKRIVFLALFFIAIAVIQAQTIHCLIFANTFDEKIGSSCTVDKDKVMVELRTISRVLNYQLKEQIFSEYDFTIENLKTSLNTLVCSPDDVVFFYFSGHGARAVNDMSDWPQLNLNPLGLNRDENYFPLEQVDGILKGKGARLCIVFGDCCNNPSKIVTPKLANKGQTVVEEVNSPEKVYSSLFGEYSGDVLISSSSRGEFSLALEDQGGLFTLSYFRGVENALNGEIQPSWDSVLTKAKSLTTEFVVNHSTQKQTPQFLVTVTKKNSPPRPPEPNGDYLSDLESILDKSLTPGKRIQMINPVHNKVFASNAIVETVGKDMKTILDRETSLGFVKRMATSAFIVSINEVSVKKDNRGMVTFLRVHETRTRK